MHRNRRHQPGRHPQQDVCRRFPRLPARRWRQRQRHDGPGPGGQRGRRAGEHGCGGGGLMAALLPPEAEASSGWVAGEV